MVVISVIIPTYNHANYILETLDSVFAQTYNDYEVIVVNDGSPDNTAEILRPLATAGQIRYIEQPNQGQATARNRGLSEATGEFIAFMDDDDLWPPDKLEWQVEILRANQRLVAIGGEMLTINGCGEPIADKRLTAGNVSRMELYCGNPFASPGQVLIRRNALEAVGGFDTTIWGSDDLDLWFRMLEVGDIAKVQSLALKYRIHESNASHMKERMLVNTKAVITKHLAKEPRSIRRECERAGTRFVYQYGAGRLIAQIRGDLRRLRLGKAFQGFWVFRHLIGQMLRDPIQLWWFVSAWKPRLSR